MKNMTNSKANSLYYMNIILFIFGLHSSIDKEIPRKLFFFISILSLVFNLIVWIFIFINNTNDLIFFSWIVKLLIVLISHTIYRYKHKNLLKILTKEMENKNIKRLSLALSIVWFIFILIMLLMCIQYIKDDITRDILFRNKFENQFVFALKIIFYTLLETSGIFYAMGLAFLQIFIYLQSYYLFYCMRGRHYNNLLFNRTVNIFLKLRRFRLDEIQIQEFHHNLNDLIGFIPFIWLLDMFFRTCINIIGIARNSSGFEIIVLYSFDVLILHLTLITVIIIVGQLNNQFNINRITSFVNKSFPPEDTIDRNFELEMIRYLQELSNRFVDEPKSCGLFVINSKLILSFLNAVITFSVMCFQLHSSFK